MLVIAPDPDTKERAEDRLAALADGSALADLTVQERTVQCGARVRLSGQTKIADQTPYTFAWSVQLTAPDSVRYGTVPQVASCGLPQPGHGLTFPLTTWPLEFGEPTGGSLALTNAGTAVARTGAGRRSGTPALSGRPGPLRGGLGGPVRCPAWPQPGPPAAARPVRRSYAARTRRRARGPGPGRGGRGRCPPRLGRQARPARRRRSPPDRASEGCGAPGRYRCCGSRCAGAPTPGSRSAGAICAARARRARPRRTPRRRRRRSGPPQRRARRPWVRQVGSGRPRVRRAATRLGHAGAPARAG